MHRCTLFCSLVHSELSCWGLISSLHLHVAHTHYGSHYSFRYFIYSVPALFANMAAATTYFAQAFPTCTAGRLSSHVSSQLGGCQPSKSECSPLWASHSVLAMPCTLNILPLYRVVQSLKGLTLWQPMNNSIVLTVCGRHAAGNEVTR
jgi:hypothetical protein